MATPRGAEKLGWGCKASEDTRVKGISAGWSLGVKAKGKHIWGTSEGHSLWHSPGERPCTHTWTG